MKGASGMVFIYGMKEKMTVLEQGCLERQILQQAVCHAIVTGQRPLLDAEGIIYIGKATTEARATNWEGRRRVDIACIHFGIQPGTCVRQSANSPYITNAL